MEGWKQFEGKRVYIETKSYRKYSGVVKAVDDSDHTLIFLHLLDIKGNIVIFAHSEIKLIQEESSK
jgi:small nuclear ribonucleoprotein (snRNP)-like protein